MVDAFLRKYRGYLLLSLVFAIVIGVILILRQPAPPPVKVEVSAPRPTRTPALIVVHVTGAVLHPDVYTLTEDSRLKDALEAAGGPSPEADTGSLNLAQPLRDGQQVRIPALSETPLANVPERSTDAGNVLPANAAVNINTASVAELDTLPGIGPTLAQRIVDDRTANGPYASVDDLARVSGIGPSLLDKIRALVVIR